MSMRPRFPGSLPPLPILCGRIAIAAILAYGVYGMISPLWLGVPVSPDLLDDYNYSRCAAELLPLANDYNLDATETYKEHDICRVPMGLPPGWYPVPYDKTWPVRWVGSATAIDGDTIIVDGQRLRLWGIDAFEVGQYCPAPEQQLWACGETALETMHNFLSTGPVMCREAMSANDRTEVQLAVCFDATGVDLGKRMVENGMALPAWRQTLHYADTERIAREGKVGAWSMPAIEPPWHWRESLEDD